MIKKIKEIYLQLTSKTSEEMAKKLKYEIETPVIIFEETPCFIDGGIGLIIERDPFTLSYGVVLLEQYYAYEADLQKLLQKEVMWVSGENLKPIIFKKKISIFKRIKNGFAKMVTRFRNWRYRY